VEKRFPRASCRKEDLRIGSEEVWRFGGLVGEVALDLNTLSHKGSADHTEIYNITRNITKHRQGINK
jgi:hypothetical protein